MEKSCNSILARPKHIIPNFEFESDLHELVEAPDFSPLDKLYNGRKAYYGDFHVHSASGGTSDGETTQEQWLAAMKELKMDFVGLMDHRQVRHMYPDSFDPEYFLYGTEPAGLWHEPKLTFHYLMVFQERDALKRILERFPDVFEFEGGIEGTYIYKRVDRDRFMQVKQAVLQEGGAFVHPHPKQQMFSDNTDDFYFGDGTTMEIIYNSSFDCSLNEHTISNYKLWLKILEKGYKMYNSATADVHFDPNSKGINVVYSAEKNGPAYVRQLRRGDFNSGCIGIKMCIGDTPVGGTVKYEDGARLLVEVNDAHELRFDPNENYRVDIITDKGLAYSAPLATIPFKIAIKLKNRRFYRVEVLRERDGCPAAIGNPIWPE